MLGQAQLTVKICEREMLTDFSIFLKIRHSVQVQTILSQF